jgi:hypothetical protein
MSSKISKIAIIGKVKTTSMYDFHDVFTFGNPWHQGSGGK